MGSPAKTVKPVTVQSPAALAHRARMKTLNMTDFHGKPSESIEAWLAKIPQEVERQVEKLGRPMNYTRVSVRIYKEKQRIG